MKNVEAEAVQTVTRIVYPFTSKDVRMVNEMKIKITDTMRALSEALETGGDLRECLGKIRVATLIQHRVLEVYYDAKKGDYPLRFVSKGFETYLVRNPMKPRSKVGPSSRPSHKIPSQRPPLKVLGLNE